MSSSTAEQIALVEAPRMKLRPWMPRRWRDAAAGQRVQLRITEPIRARCRKPKRMSPSELSIAYRRMPDGHAGAFRREFSRHSLKVMDTWAKPWVRKLWFCGVDQAGKTNTALSCIFWIVDQAPGNIFYQMPNKDASDKIMGKKLNPMLQESPRTAVKISPRADDTALGLTSLTNGMSILPSWSGSTTSTATFSARYTFSDEVDKMEMIGKEASPITRIEKRGRTQRFSKDFFASTPAGKYIYSGTMACVQVWEGTVRCPHCGELMGMTEEQVYIPDGATVDSIKADPGCIEYACDQCSELLTEADRERAYENIFSDNDCWRCTKGADIARPVDVGFLLSAFPLPDVPLAEIAETILKAKAGDLSAKRDLAHGIKAIDYKEEIIEAREEDTILAFRNEQYPRNIIPLDAAELWLLTDTQQDHFYYQIWSYGYAPEIDMHMVRHGILQTFSDLDYLLDVERFASPSGKEYRILGGLIDSGGTRRGWQKHSRTVQVYEWCSRQMRMSPVKGTWSRRDGDLITYKPVEVIPGTGKRFPPGMVPTRINVKVDYFKDELANRLGMQPDDPGAISFHSDIDAAFAKHYCTEGKHPETGEWHHERSKGRNDYWDCNVYAMILREILKTRIPLRPGSQPAAPQERKTNGQKTKKPSRW